MSSSNERRTPPPDYPEDSSSNQDEKRQQQAPTHSADEKQKPRDSVDTTIETSARAALDPADSLSHLRNAPTNSRPQSVGSHFDTYSMSSGVSRQGHDLSPDNSTEVNDVPPPAYSDSGNYKSVSIQDDGFSSKAEVLDDGRIDIRINQRSRRLSNLLLPALQQQLTIAQQPEPSPTEPSALPTPPGLAGKDVPRMNIVVQIIGSRGDIQPFIALGLKLRNNPPYHRVRIATHPVFKDFVSESGLEFFSVGGDPAELMAFMVKNPGLVPGLESLKQGEVGKRRKAMYEMLGGFWRSCIEVGDGMTPIGTAIPEPAEQGKENVFVADAIIANPPSFAHIHCAEKLGIPLHLMFTMPWTPTQAFPHPLANIRSSNTDANITNFLSYTLVEMLTWQGLGDLVNRFREKTLELEPVSMMWAPGMISRLKVPQTYCWSPALIPKPRDWGTHIRISGFYFLDLANTYTPPPDLADFLAAGEPPVYIGFGSIVVDDPNALTKMIFDAIKKTGVRALVSKGWGGLGSDAMQPPEGVFMLGNCPHDWLFKHVSCVVHHGGAGTTAIGVAMGKPTVIVPFFGDQPFWGSMVARAGAGPEPTPFKRLTADILAESIQTALTPEAQSSAEAIASKIRQENGAQNGADSFHASLASIRMNCMADPSRAAVWRVKRTEVRLSAAAAVCLVENNMLEFTDLKLCRHKEWDTDDGPIEPISGATSALLGTMGSVMMGVGDFPREIFKAFKQGEAKRAASGTVTPSLSQGASSTAGSSKASLSEPSLKTTDASSGRSSPSAEDMTASTTSASRTSTVSTMGDSEASLSKAGTTWEDPSMSTLPLGASASRESLPKESETPTPTLRDSSTREIMGSALGSNGSRPPPSPSHSGATTPTSSSFHGRMSAMATAMNMSRSRSRSQSPSRHGSLGSGRKLHKNKPEPRRQDSEMSSGSKTPSQAKEVSLDMMVGAGRGAGRIAEALLRSPMDFTVSLAQGFHNAPKLYGDEVRKQEKITGIQSGLKAAGKELAFGLYDGISGLVTQPVKGAREEGVAGMFKGLGKGVGGAVLKPGAAFWGLQGYTFKGIYEEIRRMRGSDTNNYILAARTAQGYYEYSQLTPEQRDKIIKRWNALGVERVKRRKGKEKEKQRKKQEEEENKRTKSWKHACEKRNSKKKEASFAPPTPDSSTPDVTTETMQELQDKWASSSGSREGYMTRHSIFPNSDDAAMEEAIKQSVKQTSRGDPEEDALIEQAIRTSIAEIQKDTVDSEADEQTMLDRAIKASISSASGNSNSEEHDEELKRAIEESMRSHGERLARSQSRDEGSLQESGVKKKTPPALPPRQSFHSARTVATEPDDEDDDDGDLALALRQSAHEEEERARKQKEEEDIILDYVKRASLAESQFKDKHQQQQQQQQPGSSSSAAPSIAERIPETETTEKSDAEKEEERQLEAAIQASLNEK